MVGRDGGAQRIECLGQIKAAGGGALRAQYRNIRIGRDLQHRNAGGEYDFGYQKEREGRDAGCGNKEQRAARHGQQSGHHGPLVADPLHHPTGGYCEDEVSAEKDKLHEHDREVVQVKYRLEGAGSGCH